MQHDRSTLSAHRTAGSEQDFTHRLPMPLTPLVGRKQDIQAITEEEKRHNFVASIKEMFNQGNLTVADELIAPDCLNHEVPPGMNNRCPESIRKVVMILMRFGL